VDTISSKTPTSRQY